MGLYAWAVRDGDSTNFCKGNFDYDADVDGTDAFVLKQHFGRSTLKNPCPPDGPAPVEKTGLTASYTIGDDGSLRMGVSWPNPRFTDNGNGTVTDNLTGLIWLKYANCFGTRTWDQALSDCNGLSAGWCGLIDGSTAGDWRLPNRNELNSLLDVRYANPALCNTSGTGQWTSGNPFTNVQSLNYYWSSTPFVVSAAAWKVGMEAGELTISMITDYLYVWPVRGGH